METHQRLASGWVETAEGAYKRARKALDKGDCVKALAEYTEAEIANSVAGAHLFVREALPLDPMQTAVANRHDRTATQLHYVQRDIADRCFRR